LPALAAAEHRVGGVLDVGPEDLFGARDADRVGARRPAAVPAGVDEHVAVAMAHDVRALGDALLPLRIGDDEPDRARDQTAPRGRQPRAVDPAARPHPLPDQIAAPGRVADRCGIDRPHRLADHEAAIDPRSGRAPRLGDRDARLAARAAGRVVDGPQPAVHREPRRPEVAARPGGRAPEDRADLAPAHEVARAEDREHRRPPAARGRRPVHPVSAHDRRVCDVPGNDRVAERHRAALCRRTGRRRESEHACHDEPTRPAHAASLRAMPTTTERLPEATPAGVGGLSSLAFASATRALRVIVVLVLLAAVVGAGAALRANRAAHPARPNSADERAYLTLAHDLATTGNYGGPGTAMNDPLHWPPGAPALFAAAEKLGPGAPGDLAPSAVYAAQAIVGTLAILAAFGAAALLAGPWAGLAAAAATA